MNLTVVILTRDEERHIERAIASVAPIADRIVVVDSGSTDRTVALAKARGARVLTNPWTSHASQFNWALDQLPPDTGWVLRLDADEIVTPSLRAEIATQLPSFGPEIAGARLSRRMTFMGRLIRHGGVFPVRIIRLFRHGRGRCEDRWMDEHIRVDGAVADLKGEIIDDNRNSLTWWTRKHNAYASREAIDLLNLEYRFMPHETIARLGDDPTGVKRWIKERVYARLPGGARAVAYFLYRYVLRLGFLDGRAGLVFHALQGLWYRFLVDAKLREVKSRMAETGADIETAIKEVLEIEPRRL